VPPLDIRRFRDAYRSAVADVMPFITPERQAVIARHNLGQAPGRHDLGEYLRASEKRYVRALELYNASPTAAAKEPRVLDVGGFLAAFPLALARMDVDVTLAEEYGYYYGAFDDLKAFLEAQGVTVWGGDFTKPLDTAGRSYALVANMAMVEHLADSPRQLMGNLRSVVADDGRLVLEIPNIAYWPTRLRALRGRSVHQPLELVYGSDPPFLGHHREYTEAEMRQLLEWSGFSVDRLVTLNYSSVLPAGRAARAYTALVYAPIRLRSCRELLLALASPSVSEWRGDATPPGPGAGSR
jgi:SAM-dependent methyltransferase